MFASVIFVARHLVDMRCMMRWKHFACDANLIRTASIGSAALPLNCFEFSSVGADNTWAFVSFIAAVKRAFTC